LCAGTVRKVEILTWQSQNKGKKMPAKKIDLGNCGKAEDFATKEHKERKEGN